MAANRETPGPTALAHLRVLDLAGPPAQALGKLLGQLGADVVKVEALGGDAARRAAPFRGDAPDGAESLYFAHFNTDKRGVVLDLGDERGCRRLRRLAAAADVLIEGFAPGHLEGIGLGYRRLTRNNRGLVYVSITPFGQSGPHRDFKGSELVAQAVGGLMYVQGDDAREPCMAPCEQAYQVACYHAASGALAALHRRRATGRGAHVDVSAQEAAANLMFTLARYASTGQIVRREGARSAFAPNSYYRCKDGWVCLGVFTRPHWEAFVKWMGDASLADPRLAERGLRREHAARIDGLVSDFAGGMTVAEFVEQGQRFHLCVSALNTVAGFAESPQPRERRFFVDLGHPHVGPGRYAGPPFRMSRTPAGPFRPAPLLGEHQREVLAAWLSGLPGKRGMRPRDGAQRGPTLPLRGVRIVDFTRVWAGPMASRYLGDLGAEVIKVESGGFLDEGRATMPRELYLSELHRNKLGVTLNFQREEGRDLALRLVELSDVVMENFAAGVLARRGLGYDDLRKARPDVITVGMPGYGSSGPYSRHISYGQNLMAHVGMAHLWGHADAPYDTHSKLHYPDFVGAAAAAAAVTAALEHRNETGEGQHVEIDQSEALASTMGVALLDYFVNGRSWEPAGNRSANAAPHGCYPCRGDDGWCVVECRDEDEWRALCRAMGEAALADDPRFATLGARLRHLDELNAHVADWTRARTPLQAVRLLQDAGVPAGVVQSGEQMFQDHHLRARGFVPEGGHAVWDRLGYTGVPMHLDGRPVPLGRPAPAVGEHNRYVYGEVLGLSPAEVEELARTGVIA